MNKIIYLYNFHTILSLIYNNIYKICKIYYNNKINTKLLTYYLKFTKINLKYKKMKNSIICKVNYKINLYKYKNILIKKNLLMLGIYKLYNIENIGACLRNINGAGGDAIIIFKNKNKLNQKILDISVGSITPIFIETKIFKKLIDFKNKGIDIICTNENSVENLFQINLKKSILFLLGNEQNGIKSKFIKTLCNHTVSIPMYGNIKNLNVSTISSICLYEAIRQRNF